MKKYRARRMRIVFSMVIAGFLVPGAFLLAEVTGQDIANRRAQLEQELTVIEKEIEAQRSVLQIKQRESISLERDITIFDTKIRSAELSIRARNLEISKLRNEIGSKSDIILALTEKLHREKESLGQLLRKTRELDSYSLVEVVLGTKNLSEFFKDLDSFHSIKAALKDSFKEIEETKRETKRQQDRLQAQQQEEEQLRKIKEIQKQGVQEDRQAKNRVLNVTKGEEVRYQKIVQAKKRDAASIRTELFTLRGSDAIPFERALDYANEAYERTGVRPAFLLGLIKNESRLGAYIGTGTWKKDMHPKRDQPIFLEITSRLGLDPDKMPVSKKPWYGWGGAMGPAQFIPSTWILYEKKIAKLTGHNPPNPWDPYDAFMASALLLRDNGASKGGYKAEHLAAMRYFAGWKNAKKPAYAFYGDDVLEYAQEFQELIDILK